MELNANLGWIFKIKLETFVVDWVHVSTGDMDVKADWRQGGELPKCRLEASGPGEPSAALAKVCLHSGAGVLSLGRT